MTQTIHTGNICIVLSVATDWREHTPEGDTAGLALER